MINFTVILVWRSSSVQQQDGSSISTGQFSVEQKDRGWMEPAPQHKYNVSSENLHQ